MIQADTYSSTLTVPATAPGEESSTFKFGAWPIRVFGGAAAPMFVALDVCNAIGLKDVSDAVAKLDPDEKGRGSIPTPGGRQELLAVSESGLYTMILRSRGATTAGSPARAFKRWVTAEVLPVIRKTGSYGAPAAPAPVAIDVRNPAQLTQIALQLLQVNQEQARELCGLRFDSRRERDAAPAQRAQAGGLRRLPRRRGPVLPAHGGARHRGAGGELFTWLRARKWLVDEEGWAQPGWERRRDRHFVIKHHKIGSLMRDRPM